MSRRDLTHPVVPTLAAAVFGAIYLIAAPETADMAGHTYRAWLWQQSGFALWNAQWYGGHHVAGYSLLYPPLAAIAGTRLVGVVAAVITLSAIPAAAQDPPRESMERSAGHHPMARGHAQPLLPAHRRGARLGPDLERARDGDHGRLRVGIAAAGAAAGPGHAAAAPGFAGRGVA